jgi:15-cis-phytoene synthase
VNDLALATTGAAKSNLAFALKVLPADRRADAMVFYNFCRVVDDIADEDDRSPTEKTTLLGRWKDAVRTGHGLPEELRTVIARREIDPHLLEEIILGVERDITPRPFATLAELQAYCWRVACAVGLVSIKIFGCRQPGSTTYAEELGHALQLTNILRDVGDDARIGRVYLPEDLLTRHGLTASDLLDGRAGPGLRPLMQKLAARAEGHFSRARAALPAADARAMTPAEAMRGIYHHLLTEMTRDGFQVFTKRYRVPLWRKLWILATTRLQR